MNFSIIVEAFEWLRGYCVTQEAKSFETKEFSPLQIGGFIKSTTDSIASNLEAFDQVDDISASV
jgi:hypothetical protein